MMEDVAEEPIAWQDKILFLYTMCSVGTYKYSFMEESLESISTPKAVTVFSFLGWRK